MRITEAKAQLESVRKVFDEIPSELALLEEDNHSIGAIFQKIVGGQESITQAMQEDVVRKYEVVELKEVLTKLHARLARCSEKESTATKRFETVRDVIVGMIKTRTEKSGIISKGLREARNQVQYLETKRTSLLERIQTVSTFLKELKLPAPVEVVAQASGSASSLSQEDEYLIPSGFFDADEETISQQIKRFFTYRNILLGAAGSAVAVAMGVGLRIIVLQGIH